MSNAVRWTLAALVLSLATAPIGAQQRGAPPKTPPKTTKPAPKPTAKPAPPPDPRQVVTELQKRAAVTAQHYEGLLR